MNDFEYDVYRKKRVAHGAKNRKNGSKSKRCSLPSDNMTKKQWEERCGEVVSYNLAKPMTWDEFRKLPVHIQKEYLLNLIEKHSASARDISQMLGTSTSNFSHYCKRKEFGLAFSSKPGPKGVEPAFQDFCARAVQAAKELEAAEKQTQSPAKAADEDIPCGQPEPFHTHLRTMKLTEFSMRFCGPADLDNICNSLRLAIQNGVDADIRVHFHALPPPREASPGCPAGRENTEACN